MCRKSNDRTDVANLISSLGSVENVLPQTSNAIIVPEFSSKSGEKVLTISSRINDLSKGLAATGTPEQQEKLMYAIVSEIAKLDMTIRESLLERRDDQFYSREKELIKRAFISVTAPENAVLRICLPPLIGRQFRGSYNIYWKLKAALSQFEKDHPFPHLNNEKVVLIYKRYSTNLAVGHSCDNDNWEMKRATNAIAEALNYSDNPEHFSMLYTTVKSSVDCVEATVVRQADMHLFLEYLEKGTPEDQALFNWK